MAKFEIFRWVNPSRAGHLRTAVFMDGKRVLVTAEPIIKLGDGNRDPWDTVTLTILADDLQVFSHAPEGEG